MGYLCRAGLMNQYDTFASGNRFHTGRGSSCLSVFIISLLDQSGPLPGPEWGEGSGTTKAPLRTHHGQPRKAEGEQEGTAASIFIEAFHRVVMATAHKAAEETVSVSSLSFPAKKVYEFSSRRENGGMPLHCHTAGRGASCLMGEGFPSQVRLA